MDTVHIIGWAGIALGLIVEAGLMTVILRLPHPEGEGHAQEEHTHAE